MRLLLDSGLDQWFDVHHTKLGNEFLVYLPGEGFGEAVRMHVGRTDPIHLNSPLVSPLLDPMFGDIDMAKFCIHLAGILGDEVNCLLIVAGDASHAFVIRKSKAGE